MRCRVGAWVPSRCSALLVVRSIYTLSVWYVLITDLKKLLGYCQLVMAVRPLFHMAVETTTMLAL